MGELQKHRNAKQERGSVGEREINVIQDLGNAEHNGKIEERGHAEREGPQECAPISENETGIINKLVKREATESQNRLVKETGSKIRLVQRDSS